MKYLGLFLVIVAVAVLSISLDRAKLQERDASSAMTVSSVSGEYDFDMTNITQVIILPNILQEISGLSYDYLQQQLLAINDEQGILFGLSQKEGKIVEQMEFGKKGDYEGVAYSENKRFVIKSNGDIYVINKNESGRTVEIIKTPLKSENDVEGITYVAEEESLILACKGKPSIQKSTNKKSEKSFFRFDLTTMTLGEDPIFTISDSTLLGYLDSNHALNNLPKYKQKSLKNRIRKFSPSGIAWHAQSRQFFILSSLGKLLVITNSEGKINKVEFLDEKVHLQPEGICFSDPKTMYISNEGRNLIAKIMVYRSR